MSPAYHRSPTPSPTPPPTPTPPQSYAWESLIGFPPSPWNSWQNKCSANRKHGYDQEYCIEQTFSAPKLLVIYYSRLEASFKFFTHIGFSFLMRHITCNLHPKIFKKLRSTVKEKNKTLQIYNQTNHLHQSISLIVSKQRINTVTIQYLFNSYKDIGAVH